MNNNYFRAAHWCLSFEQLLFFRYNPGDVLLVYPQNLKESVTIALEAFGYDDAVLDKHFFLEANDESAQLPPAFLFEGLCDSGCCFDVRMLSEIAFNSVIY